MRWAVQIVAFCISCAIAGNYANISSPGLLVQQPQGIEAEETSINLLGEAKSTAPWTVLTFASIFSLRSNSAVNVLRGNCLVSADFIPSLRNASSGEKWIAAVWVPQSCPIFAIVGPSAYVPPANGAKSPLINREMFARKIAEYKTRGYVPAQIFVTNSADGQANFAASLSFDREHSDFQLWFSAASDAEDWKNFERFLMQGYRLTTLTGYTDNGRRSFVGVWQRPSQNDRIEYKAHYNLPLFECITLDAVYKDNGFTLTRFQVYGSENMPNCVAIWQRVGSQYSHLIKSDTDLRRLLLGMLDSPLYPKQLSSFTSASGVTRYYAVFSDYTSPGYPAIWQDREIPSNYLEGSREGFLPADLQTIDSHVKAFMRLHQLPAVTFAIVKDEQLKMAAAYGYADLVQRFPASPSTLVRIGSVSKTLTAVAIFKLIDEGRLELDAHIFGPGTIFGTRYGSRPYPPNLLAMRVRHLLAHTEGGWSGREGDGYPDPMFVRYDLGDDELISWVLDVYPLPYAPATHWQYCNFGYFLAGKVVEAVSGQPYEQYVRQEIAAPLGMARTVVGGMSLAERLPNEALLYDLGVFESYEFPMRRNQADGGWVSTPVQLLKFMTSVDKFGRRGDILSRAAEDSMFQPSAASNGSDSQGWPTNRGPFHGAPPSWRGVHHAGNTFAASAMLARGDDGFEFAYIQNGGISLNNENFDIMLQVYADVTVWPAHDLFQRNKEDA